MMSIMQLINPAFNKIVWEYQRLRNIQLSEVKQLDDKSGFQLTFNTPSLSDPSKSYEQTVFLESVKDLSNRSNCLVRCDCPDFIYHYQTRLFFSKGLYGEPDSKKMPKKVKFGACKHINAVLAEMLKRFRNEIIKSE